MEPAAKDFEISTLGECRVPSPMTNGVQFVPEKERVVFDARLEDILNACEEGEIPSFEVAGPRDTIYFDPSKLKCGIVTCGGICPGLNNVIRAIVLSLHFHYGVPTVFGFRYGFEGLSPKYRHPPLELLHSEVAEIHQVGGTILGTSRGPQDVSEMVDTLERMNVRLLFVIGGDGTLRGGHALSEEIQRRGLKIGIVGVPKTIDNDISHMSKSFGFETAVEESRKAIYGAHVEARGARNGVGLVKLMGRQSGFISASATLANNEVNFCLVPEVPFRLETFLDALRKRLEHRRHAVVVVAEGAGQDLIGEHHRRDLSGNVRLHDIGLFLRAEIQGHFEELGMDMTLKYIDPSYMIRSMPANTEDSVFCLMLGHNAVHAGMAGRTDVVVGYWSGQYTHVPIPLAVSERKQIDPRGRLWNSVLQATGQPRDMR